MNKTKRLLRRGLGTIGAVFSIAAIAIAQRDANRLDGQGAQELFAGVAVVELFTSESCSSCPPADRNLARIAKKFANARMQVFPLAFHVDYWNDLGWVDRFSTKAFSKRQREYASVLDDHSVYTPQMVVNGRIAFNGSDAKQADEAIGAALEDTGSNAFLLEIAVKEKHDAFAVAYKASNADVSLGSDSPYLLHIATVLDQAQSAVESGENAGKELTHVWIVRNLNTAALTDAAGSLNIDKTAIVTGHTKLVAFVQHRKTGRILGATALSL